MLQRYRVPYIDVAVINQIVGIIGDHQKARRVLQELGHTAAVRTIDAAEQAQYAARLISEGWQRNDVQIVLMQRYGVSRRVAYRRIHWALNIRRAERIISETAKMVTHG